jgi:hypothetical protein
LTFLFPALLAVAAFILGVRLGIALGYRGARRELQKRAPPSLRP